MERLFWLVTQRAIRPASVRTTQELVRRIEAFVWTATPESILAKLARLLKAVIRPPSRPT